MSTILKNILQFSGLTVGVPAVLPHLLNVNGIPVIPDLVGANGPNYTITADINNVTVTRLSPAAAAVHVYVEHWHTIEAATPLLPVGFAALLPFIFAAGDGGAGGLTVGTAMFFGTTTGTGSTQNDYAATVAVGAPVPFPQDGPASGGAVSRSTATTFLVNTTAIYEVSWQVGFSEASQLQLAIGGTPVVDTTATSGAGTQQNTNTALVSLTAGDLVTLINPAGNATALTVTPSDGSLTHCQAPNITFVRVS